MTSATGEAQSMARAGTPAGLLHHDVRPLQARLSLGRPTDASGFELQPDSALKWLTTSAWPSLAAV